MQTRILDLDGSLIRQARFVRHSQAAILPLQDWGPDIRLACRFSTFERFEERLTLLAGSASDATPGVTFLGSGDFHHVSLALLRRLRQPCNLLVLDNHPDWMRGVPFLHCGTWLYHAAHLPTVQRIFHVGGDVDFDNAYRVLTPWSLLRSGKIIVAPSRRRFLGRRWAGIEHQPLRQRPEEPTPRSAVDEWLSLFRGELAARPLYISLDKDVLTASESIVNWDSGHLTVREVTDVLRAFLEAAGGEMAGMDTVGDWSPVRLRGLLRRALHWTEHPHLPIDPDEAARRNEELNLTLLQAVASGPPAAAHRENIVRAAG
jgi:hypothetical protein